MDTKLSLLAASEKTHSGCTAVTAFLRLEDENGNAVGLAGGVGPAVKVKKGKVEGDAGAALKVAREAEEGSGASLRASSEAVTEASTPVSETTESEKKPKMGTGEGVLRGKIKDLLTGTKPTDSATPPEPSPIFPQLSSSPTAIDSFPAPKSSTIVTTPDVEIKGPADVMKAARRTLYTANVGDARAVLS